MENNTQKQSLDDRLFKEMCEESSVEENTPNEAKHKGKGTFKRLPDGKYKGEVHIVVNKVGNPESPNYGLTKYEIQLKVLEGEYAGKMAYYNRIIQPYNLASPTNDDPQSVEYREWSAVYKLYMKETDKYLQKCGVDISDTDKDRFVQKIAVYNRRRQAISFDMKNGQPYFNYPIINAVEDSSDSLFKEAGLPDGNDLPLN